jgi:hypothetical protein
MPRLRHASSEQRKACFEQFEQRLVMSAQTVAALLPELQLAGPALTQQVISQPLNMTSVSPTTAAAAIAAQYGFDGHGQTVAVIDSGIAWDHHALGGGFGQGHKVVGGWDFAENDAIPFDSGAAAMHGTHVAGIVASEHERYRGVSSGADLVSLRVFNDQGEGNLEWVRQALNWVNQHRTSFENPITTVVMSLGTTWNAHNTPGWAMLESELAALKQAGIFISVAAGNSFHDYNSTGLSYPAVSQHVVPVASHDSSGEMSDFSQRSNRVLVAPGESIRSTIPNSLFVNGMTNRFMALTGTSMAAPYIAGASAILREANEFMGRTGISQEVLYQQMLDSADRIFDSATNSSYSRINLAAALRNVIPDLEGNSAESAKSIGQLGGGQQIKGTIGKLDDIDFFSFRAQSSGQIRLTINSTHDLEAVVNVVGSQATINGNVVTFAVEAGREYKFSVGTNEGTGHYSIDTHLQAGPPAIPWGQIRSNLFANQSIQGQSLYRMQASQSGILAIQTNSIHSGNLRLEIYDGQMNRIGTCSGECHDLRLSTVVSQGETYFLRAIGNVQSVNFAVGNSVSISGGVLTLNGTAGNDNFEINARNGFAIKVNGIAYTFQQSEIQSVRIDGDTGADSMLLWLGSQNDVVTSRTDGLSVSNSGFSLIASRISYSFVDAGTGSNSIVMNESSGADRFVAGVYSSELSGIGFTTTANNFQSVKAVSSGGEDQAEFSGTVNQEHFEVNGSSSSMTSGQVRVVAEKFALNRMDGAGGHDLATLTEAAGDRHINIRYQFAAIHGVDRSVGIAGVAKVNVIGQEGAASLKFFDSFENDIMVVDNGAASMKSGSLFRADTTGFRNIHLESQSGQDSVQLYDTPGNDTFLSFGHRTELRSANLNVVTTGAAIVLMTSKWGGSDTAIITGTQGNDWLAVEQQNVSLHDSLGRSRVAQGVSEVSLNLGGGYDEANYRGSTQAEALRVDRSKTEFQTARQNFRVTNAEKTNFAGSGGNDRVVLNELNLLQGLGNRAIAYLDQHQVTVEDFANLEAGSVDTAMAEYDLDLVDFQYLLRGNWRPF